MKNKKYLIFFTLLSFIIFLDSAKALDIVLIDSQTDIKDHIRPGTWVFTDIDRTLVSKEKSTPSDYELQPAYTALLKRLQKSGVPLFGLTSRGAEDYDFTIKQLNVLGLDFSRSLKLANITDLPSNHFQTSNIFFKNGILFAPEDPTNPEGNIRGQILKTFLETFPLENKTLLVVDDQIERLNDIQEHIQMEGILACFHSYGQLIFKSERLPTDFPLSLKGLEEDEAVHYWYTSGWRLIDRPTGKTYVLQTHDFLEETKQEILLLRLYEKLGMPVPKFIILELNTSKTPLENFKSAPKNYCLLTEDYFRWSRKKTKKYQKHYLKTHFIMNAFLSYTDILENEILKEMIGQDKENPYLNVLQPNSFVSTKHHRKGKPKQRNLDWSIYKVAQLDWVNEQLKNEEGAAIFASLNTKELKEQIGDLLSKKELVLTTFHETNRILNLENSEKIISLLQQRLDDLQSCFAEL